MADLATTLLPDIRSYLKITWQDDATDKLVTGYINRGMKRLQTIAGASLDFTVEDMPRSLLFDYCRYANSQALEVFEQNFQSELLDLNLYTQAPIISGLVILLLGEDSVGCQVSVSPAPDEGSLYVYAVGASLVLPQRMDVCAPGAVFSAWDGFSGISAAPGQDIMIVEVNDEYKAVRAGKVTITA